mgnify:FL=1
MLKSEIDEILRQTLSDLRLSRSEKKGLRAVLGDMELSEGDYGQLRKSAFEIAAEALNDSRSRQVVEWLEELMKVLVPRGKITEKSPRAYFSPEADCRDRILSLFHAARRSVDICVFTITDNQLTREIMASHSRGLKIRIVTDDETSEHQGSDTKQLEEAGIPVRFDNDEQHMHNKFAVFDGKAVCTGSYNWTRSAAEHNLENIVVFHDPSICGKFSGEFERLWELFS